MAIAKGCYEDGLVNQELCLQVQLSLNHDRPSGTGPRLQDSKTAAATLYRKKLDKNIYFQSSTRPNTLLN